MKTKITVQTLIDAPLKKVWKYWTTPEDVINWNNASDDWHTPAASNDLRDGGRFSYRMESKDGRNGFDFGGTYTKVVPLSSIDSTLDDQRKVSVVFSEINGRTQVAETFETEDTNSVEMQRSGWQAILDNFKKYAELKK